MASKLKYLIPLLVLMLGSAYMNAYNEVGDSIEITIAFISPLLAYVAIAALIAKFQGLELFSSNFIKYFSVALIATTIAETAYPAFIYRDQTVPSDLWTIFSIQLLFNIYIVRVIKNDQSN
ncbi:hypothetical protein TW84_19880 [Vibrio neptunius]|uniref:hypothetical protein n=1 Tax=Vibrio neptunius TaxID=170651 RepID=UPI0005FA121E|nr:hypothetical protein [Vibrio neptunius]KJY86357.1 hypothetical protein TW84_19880 [Vibrio neptunius]